MNSKSEKNDLLQRYKEELIENEKSEATVIKYPESVKLISRVITNRFYLLGY